MDEQGKPIDTTAKSNIMDVATVSPADDATPIGATATEVTSETLGHAIDKADAVTTAEEPVCENEAQAEALPDATDSKGGDAESSSRQTDTLSGEEPLQNANNPEGSEILHKLDGIVSAVESLESHISTLESKFLEVVDNVEKSLAGLRESFDARLRYDTMKDEAISRLNKELDGYRRGAIAKDVSSLIDNIILEIDGTRRIAKRFEAMEPNEVNFSKVVSELADGAEALEDSVLSRVGVRRYQTSELGHFDVDRHALIKDAYVDTTDTSKDNLIERSVRCGYERIVPTGDGGTRSVVVRPEQVTVYRFVAASNSDAGEPEREPTGTDASAEVK